MSRTIGTLAVIAGIVLMGASGTSGAVSARTPIRIDAQVQGYESCSGKFLLSLGTKGDAGKVQCHFHWGSDGKTPEGLPFSPFTQTLTLIGKAGTLDIVSTGRTYDMGFGRSYMWEGTWRITKATDEYAGLAGRGVWKGGINRARHSFFARYAALVTGA
jgi:hypothetical protein